MIGNTTLSQLASLRNYRSQRFSTYDRTGGNLDYWKIPAGQTRAIAQTSAAGCIKHIWMTAACPSPHYARKIVLRMYWDGEQTPSVECPLGDFFGLGHGLFKNFNSLPLQMSPQGGRGLNCWFPMPFGRGMKMTVSNEADEEMLFFFNIDWERYDTARETEGLARFHAQWRRENPTTGYTIPDGPAPADTEKWRKAYWNGLKNKDGKDNYVILEAEGRGHYVGCHLDIDCFQRQMSDWYGEGDEMIFIDGETWPPSLHGTGTEDYVNMAFCPREEYCSPYHGLTLYNGSLNANEWRWKGKQSCYRYHVEDPIAFQKSIRVTIEHGEANILSNDIASTAYWYQLEPHTPFPKLLPVEQRLPRPDEPQYVAEKKAPRKSQKRRKS